MPCISVAVVVCVASALACTIPGERGVGHGTADLVGRSGQKISGPCRYEVHTQWATSLPFIITLRDTASSLALTFSGRNAPRPGSFRVAPPNRVEPDWIVGLFEMNANSRTVRGTVEGTLEISSIGDTLAFVVRGTIRHFDTLTVDAACRVGPRG